MLKDELKKYKLTTDELKEKIHEATEKPAKTDTALEKKNESHFQ
jgi:hypothetical protein